MKNAALMFDIVDSRRYSKRLDVQTLVMDCVSYLNRQYRDQIKKEVVASAGDEFQGLFLNLPAAYSYMRKLQLLLYPIKTRGGIGYGDIKYDVDEWLSTACDGDAYYLCRDALNALSEKKDNAICINRGSAEDKYLNLFIAANMAVKNEQTQVARLIELIADVMYPLDEKAEDRQFYRGLFEKRKQIIETETWNKVIGKIKEVDPVKLNLDYLFETKRIQGPAAAQGGLRMEEFWSHGMSTQIAAVLGTKRQNSDRYITAGKIRPSRTMDKAIYDMLGESK